MSMKEFYAKKTGFRDKPGMTDSGVIASISGDRSSVKLFGAIRVDTHTPDLFLILAKTKKI